MSKKKNLYLLTADDLRKIKFLAQTLEKALAELIELRRVTTFDDNRKHYQPHETDLIEEHSHLQYELQDLSKNEF